MARERATDHWDDFPAHVHLTPAQVAACQRLASQDGGDPTGYTIDAVLPDGEILVYTYGPGDTYIIGRHGGVDEVITRRVREDAAA